MFGNKKKDAVDPTPYSPFRIPPMGSLGEEFDERISLPLQPHEVLAQQGKNAAKKLSKKDIEALRPDEVRFLRYRAKSHPLAVVAWVLFFCALTSTGPALEWRTLLAGFAILFSILSLVVIKSSVRLHGGRWPAIVAGTLAAALLGFTYYQFGELPVPFGLL